MLFDINEDIAEDPVTVATNICKSYIARNGDNVENICGVYNAIQAFEMVDEFTSYLELLKTNVRALTLPIERTLTYYEGVHNLDFIDFVDWLSVYNLFEPSTSNILAKLHNLVEYSEHTSVIEGFGEENSNLITSLGAFIPDHKEDYSKRRNLLDAYVPTFGVKWRELLDLYFNTVASPSPRFGQQFPSTGSSSKAALGLENVYEVFIPYSVGSTQVLFDRLYAGFDTEYGVLLFGEIQSYINDDILYSEWSGDIYRLTSGSQAPVEAGHFERFYDDTKIHIEFPFLVIELDSTPTRVTYTVEADLVSALILSERFVSEEEGSAVVFTPQVGSVWYPLFRLWDYENTRPSDTYYYDETEFFTMEASGIDITFEDFEDFNVEYIHLFTFSSVSTGGGMASEILVDKSGNIIDGTPANDLDPYYNYYQYDYDPYNPNEPSPAVSNSRTPSTTVSVSPAVSQSQTRTPTPVPQSQTRTPTPTRTKNGPSNSATVSSAAPQSQTRTPTPLPDSLVSLPGSLSSITSDSSFSSISFSKSSSSSSSSSSTSDSSASAQILPSILFGILFVLAIIF